MSTDALFRDLLLTAFGYRYGMLLLVFPFSLRGLRDNGNFFTDSAAVVIVRSLLCVGCCSSVLISEYYLMACSSSSTG